MNKIFIVSILMMIVIAGFSGNALAKKKNIVKVKAKPDKPIKTRSDEALYCTMNNLPFDFSSLDETFEFVNARYDCSDFRLQSLIRLLYDKTDKIPDSTFIEIKNTLTGFKYWMDQPGEDAMCFWSENHQLLFAVSEYLAGQYFQDEVFTNDGKTGKEHAEIGKERIEIWLEQRWLYGFTEWYSNTYYVEDIAPLSNLIDFSNDEELAQKGRIIMDLLLYDIATQSFKGTFISSSGRCYEKGKRSHENNSTRSISEHIWGTPWGYDYEDRKGLGLNFIYSTNYAVPEVIRQIGLDTEEQIILASNGLNLNELKKEGLNGLELPQIMMQWAMEGFTNPEIINNSVKYIHRNNMLSNEFLYDFRTINNWFLRELGLLPMVSRILNPVSNGTAIERANVYNYKTPDYMLATAQNYHPGDYGDQHHIWNATLSDELSIFTTHPAKALSDKGALSGSPAYWVGNGRNPHSVQSKNVVMSMYKIPKKKGFLEKGLVKGTHAHFPKEIFDKVMVDRNYAFGQYGDVYVAFIGKNPLYYVGESTYDLFQDGRKTFWIFEISTKTLDGSFETFIERIKSNEVAFTGNKLSYHTEKQNMEMKYDHYFKVNNENIDTEYQRFESKYATVNRKAQTIKIGKGDHSLFLDFYKGLREVN
ncbi:MAG: hypothetical protein ACERKD_14210 [Prolixibacteraceae bacterium]